MRLLFSIISLSRDLILGRLPLVSLGDEVERRLGQLAPVDAPDVLSDLADVDALAVGHGLGGPLLLEDELGHLLLLCLAQVAEKEDIQ